MIVQVEYFTDVTHFLTFDEHMPWVAQWNAFQFDIRHSILKFFFSIYK